METADSAETLVKLCKATRRHKTVIFNVTVEPLARLHIHEGQGSHLVVRGIEVFRFFFSDPPSRFRDSVSNYATVTSFQILSSSSAAILHFDALQSESLAASLNKVKIKLSL
jgi:hypothetical protein